MVGATSASTSAWDLAGDGVSGWLHCLRLQSVRGTLNPNRMAKNGNNGTFRIGTWNTEWVKPDAPRGNIISYQLAATNCDILCVTEGYAGILPNEGHLIDAGPDWGYPIVPGRRKVLLWSKRPWTPHTHALGSGKLPEGRFVAGSTETPSGA